MSNPAITDWRVCRVWLLGASSGIGAALASGVLLRGARVAFSARNAERLNAVAADAERAVVLPCDAADEDGPRAAWATLLATWSGVDLAIYVAADYLPMRAWGIDMPQARRMIDINLVAAVVFARGVVPQLLRQKRGQIVRRDRRYIQRVKVP